MPRFLWSLWQIGALDRVESEYVFAVPILIWTVLRPREITHLFMMRLKPSGKNHASLYWFLSSTFIPQTKIQYAPEFNITSYVHWNLNKNLKMKKKRKSTKARCPGSSDSTDSDAGFLFLGWGLWLRRWGMEPGPSGTTGQVWPGPVHCSGVFRGH